MAPSLKSTLITKPVTPGADLNLLDRIKAPGELVPVRYRSFGWIGDRDRGALAAGA